MGAIDLCEMMQTCIRTVVSVANACDTVVNIKKRKCK